MGISFEDKGSERGSIVLMLGTESDDYVEHLIEHPTHVWLSTGDDGESDIIAIEAEDNTKTILQLRPLPALPQRMINGLMALGIPEGQALKYRARLEAGEFLVVVHGTQEEVVRAREILQATDQIDLQTHQKAAA